MPIFRRTTLGAAALAAGILAAGFASAEGDPTGTWLTETGDSTVRISRCGAGYCGTVASTANNGRDVNNPDASLRSRPVTGIRLFTAGTPSKDGFSGTLYNPKDGKTYEGGLKVTGPNTVVVSGCVMSIFCKGQTWTRAK